MKYKDEELPTAPVSEVITQFESASEFGDKINENKRSIESNVPIQMYFYKTTKNAVLFNGGYMEVYIPSIDLDRSASINGQEIQTFGIFAINIWDSGPENPNIPPKYSTRYKLPTIIDTLPSSITKRTMSVHGEPATQYLVLGYHRNDVFIKSTIAIKSNKILSTFVEMIMKAFINKIVSYDEMVPLILECCDINGVSFGVNSTTLELVIAAQARSAADWSIPYRMVINKRGEYRASDMKLIKMSDIPHVTSTFSSFAFQDINYAITASAKRHRNKETQKISDVEQIMKY